MLELFHQHFYFDSTEGFAYPKNKFKRRKLEKEKDCKRLSMNSFLNGVREKECKNPLMLLDECLAEFLMRRFDDFNFSMGVACEGTEFFFGYDVDLTMECKDFLNKYWKEGSCLNMYRVNNSHRENEWKELLSDKLRIQRKIEELEARAAETEEAILEKQTMIKVEEKVKKAVVKKMEEIQTENNNVRKRYVLYPLIYYRKNRQTFPIVGEDPIMYQEFLTTDMEDEETFYEGKWWCYHDWPYYNLAIVQYYHKKSIVNMKHLIKWHEESNRCQFTNQGLTRACIRRIKQWKPYYAVELDTLPVLKLEYEEESEEVAQNDHIIVLY